MAVRPPTPADGRCGALTRALPGTLDGRDRRDVTPASPATAAWGQPPVRLRCGVSRPAGLTPTAELIVINGIEWQLRETTRAYVFTTAHRAPRVQVSVPGSTPREQATGPLVDLTRPLRAATRPARDL